MAEITNWKRSLSTPDEYGDIDIQPPLSKPEDFIELQAKMDMIFGVSACSAYKSNDISLGPIRLEVHSY